MDALEKTGNKLDQAQYIREVLAGSCLEQANPARTPIGKIQDVKDEDDLLPSESESSRISLTMSKLLSLVGSLLRLSRCTRPDFAFPCTGPASERMHRETENGDERNDLLVI
ncbi:unnamed protein product [Peronospora farinosa]|uniref:Uncharacterized protein n=1 Tax=Peronospora farinosa TaxID=134698 RepID=A0AAV0THQ9_9STRA|nr:unnamed protein product [Peronospora farinosa]CAI5722153.1 unnamed protein product [Peronospora farinosa]